MDPTCHKSFTRMLVAQPEDESLKARLLLSISSTVINYHHEDPPPKGGEKPLPGECITLKLRGQLGGADINQVFCSHKIGLVKKSV